MSCPSDFMRIAAAIPLEVSTSALTPPGAVSPPGILASCTFLSQRLRGHHVRVGTVGNAQRCLLTHMRVCPVGIHQVGWS